MSTDLHRPVYHFLPPANWMNDPNGLIQWKGQYHLFYQHYPGGAFWSTMYWGHAVSADLVHWTHLPIAMAPTPGSPDEDGCWSGCAVNHHGTPTVIYTGFRGGAQLPCLATSRDDLLTWKKYEGNPIIASPPPGYEVQGFRDHCVWREDDEWRMIIGSGINGVGGTAFLYRSLDLRQWQYIAPLCIGDMSQTGQMWECPDFFPLGGKHVLMISALPAGKVLYLTGAYAGNVFVPDKQGIADDGCFYAPLSMTDSTGRRLMWGWLREERSQAAQKAAGWSGVMSLPRVLGLVPDGTLSAGPAPEIEGLRGRPYHLEQVELAPGSQGLLSQVKGNALRFWPNSSRVTSPGLACTSIVLRMASNTPTLSTMQRAAAYIWTARIRARVTRCNAGSRATRWRSRRARGSNCACSLTNPSSKCSPMGGSAWPAASIPREPIAWGFRCLFRAAAPGSSRWIFGRCARFGRARACERNELET